METQNRELVVEDVKGNREIAYALLTADHPLFITQNVVEEDGKLRLESIITEEHYNWDSLASMIDEEKIRHLLNIGNIYSALKDTTYTYQLTPENLMFSRNAEPMLVFKGIKDQVPPYKSLSASEFTQSFKAMIVSLLDKKTTYEGLIEGKLPFYKGKLFCESIINAETLEEVQNLLLTKYQEEKKDNQEKYSRISNKTIFGLKLATILTSAVGLISLVGVLYFLLFAMPRQEMISALRLAFVHQDYSKVVTSIKNTDSKSLSQDDKYMVAYSVIMTEPLTEQQKTELGKISTQSNSDYLRYWILIGQSNIDEAMDIASYLDDPQLMMYGLTKKIDAVQRNPELSAEERTKQLNSYKGKLEELKKAYLTPKEVDATTKNPDKK